MLFSHCSNLSKQFLFHWTDCFLPLWEVGECLHPLFVRAGAQLNLFFVRSPFISCDPVLSTHPYRVWKARVDKAAGAGGGGWGWLHAPLVLILVVYGKPDLKPHNTICY